MSNKIKYYPVGNGDQSLITLKDETTIIVDCNIRESAKGDADEEKYDVKADLLESIKKRGENPFVDIFILTHGDQDHCRGFKANFYQGDPKKYTEKNRKADEIIIEEMWFSPMIAEEHSNDDEDAYQKEAERRLDLHRKGSADKDLPGNRIRIIGYDGNKKYDDLDELRSIPGDIVTTFNKKAQDTFSVFIHAPFKEQLTSSEKDKNHTSIVFQARFKESSTSTDFCALAMFGGDADHYAWKIILEKTKKKKNDVNQKALNWDIFLAPHHCSWTFFNDTPYKDAKNEIDNSKPQPTSLEILDYKLEGAKVIASSKKIVDDDDNPPHYPAKTEYVSKVKAENFKNTEEFYSEFELPIVFIIDKNGPTLKKSNINIGISTGISKPSRAGRS